MGKEKGEDEGEDERENPEERTYIVLFSYLYT